MVLENILHRLIYTVITGTYLRLTWNDAIKVKELAEDTNSEDRAKQVVSVGLEMRTGHILSLHVSHPLQKLCTGRK